MYIILNNSDEALDIRFLTGLKQLVTKWKAVGDHLGVPDSELDAIQNNNSGHVHRNEDCLREMFLWWLRNGTDVTARKLAKALHDVDEHGVEAKVNRKFGE